MTTNGNDEVLRWNYLIKHVRKGKIKKKNVGKSKGRRRRKQLLNGLKET
jgi:hypothetical protein